MQGAIELAAADLLDRALLANQFLLLRRLSHVQVSLTIGQSSKEGRLALMALIKRAL